MQNSDDGCCNTAGFLKARHLSLSLSGAPAFRCGNLILYLDDSTRIVLGGACGHIKAITPSLFPHERKLGLHKAWSGTR